MRKKNEYNTNPLDFPSENRLTFKLTSPRCSDGNSARRWLQNDEKFYADLNSPNENANEMQKELEKRGKSEAENSFMQFRSLKGFAMELLKRSAIVLWRATFAPEQKRWKS